VIDPEEVRDSALLLDILEWIKTMRSDPNAQFVLDMMIDHRKTREIVMPCWLFKLVLNDLEVYASSTLAKRGVDLPSVPAPPHQEAGEEPR
jgi:hypothetical protein